MPSPHGLGQARSSTYEGIGFQRCVTSDKVAALSNSVGCGPNPTVSKLMQSLLEYLRHSPRYWVRFAKYNIAFPKTGSHFRDHALRPEVLEDHLVGPARRARPLGRGAHGPGQQRHAEQVARE